MNCNVIKIQAISFSDTECIVDFAYVWVIYEVNAGKGPP